MVKFIIARHGFSVFNKEKRFSGQFDVELNEVGLKQAKETADFVFKNFKIDKIYSSDLKRAKTTAELLSLALNLPVIYDKNFREIDVGKWQTLTFEEVKNKFPISLEIYKNDVGFGHPDGGESFADFTTRCAYIIKKLATENDGKTLFISTHGGFIKAIRCAFSGLPLSEMKNIPYVANSSLTILEYEKGKWNFVATGITDHLSEKATEFMVQ